MEIGTLRRWLDDYGSAWRTRSHEAVGRLFTQEALYFETPYSEPFRGRGGIETYWKTVTKDQREIEVSSEPVGVVGRTGIATWSARFKLESSGASVELNGVFLLEFDEQGLCSTLREWWHARPPA